MLKHFNIKIENPLVFMEQTTMKQFIQGDEKVKYEVLMQAMNFKSLEQKWWCGRCITPSFNITEDNLSSMNSMLHRYKDVELGKKKQIRDEAFEQVRAVQHLEDRQKQILDLEKKMVWSDVQSLEEEIDEAEGEVAQIDHTIEKIQNTRDATSKELETILSESSAVDAKIQAVKNDLTIYMDDVERVTKELDEILAPVDEAKMKIEMNKSRMNACDREMQSIRRNINSIAEQMRQKENDTRKKQQTESLQAAIDGLSSRCEALDRDIARVLEEKEGLQRSVSEVNDQRRDALGAQQTSNHELTALKNSRMNLERSSKESHEKYGANVKNMFDELRSYTPQRPIFFPIGDYVSVKKGCEQWASTIECYLSSVLCGAVCCRGCTRDINKVKALMHKYHVTFMSIVIVDYQGQQAIDRSRVTTLSPTIMDVLEFKSEVVRKALIIQNRIEARLLVDSYDDVTRLTGSGTVRSMPQFVSSMITKNGDNHRVINGKPISEMNRRTPTGVLQSDVTPLLRELGEKIARQTEVVERDKEAVRRLSKQLDDIRRRAEANSSELKRKENEKTNTQLTLNRKRRELDMLVGDGEEDELAELRTQQQQLEQTFEEKSEEKKRYAEESTMLQEAVATQDAMVKAANERREIMIKKVEEAKGRIRELRMKEDVTSARMKMEAKIKKCDETKSVLEKDKKKKETALEAKKKTLTESLTALASEERPSERVNKKQCQALIAKCREDLNVELEKLGIRDLDALKKAAEEKAAAYQKCNDEYKAIKREGQEMDRLDKRQKMTYTELRNEAQQQICKRFTKFLSQRKAEGKVDIDHTKKQVSLAVKMDSTNEIASSQVSNIRVLSGGEKSFVTLSLIMATTHVIESPFFIMDEFDVFMDEANRVVSLHTIIDTARQEGKQFIFITPHNLETVVKEMNKDKENSSIGIYELHDHQQGRAS